jgi:hypothetical protein
LTDCRRYWNNPETIVAGYSLSDNPTSEALAITAMH